MKNILFILLIYFLIAGCSKKTVSNTQHVPIISITNTTIISLPMGWHLANSYMKNFPAGIQLYVIDSIFNGQKIKAFCLAYDSKIKTLEFKPVLSAVAKKPSAFYKEEPGVTYACINGGFFGANQSFSLVKYNNVVSSPNIKVLTRLYNGNKTTYYPTRAAFGITNTGAPTLSWIYNVGAVNNLIYEYPFASPNEINTMPQKLPTETFPAGSAVWQTVSAIGGSPVLIKNNIVQITDKQELIEVENAISRPRSAIGYTNNGIILIFAVEGDNLPYYAGVNLQNLAQLLKSFNCVSAMNLDGGGSTSLFVNGKQTVRPGDKGIERIVVSALLIKQK